MKLYSGLALLVVSGMTATAQVDTRTEPLRVTLGNISNDYTVRVEVNGNHLAGMKGGQSEILQLFAANDPRKTRVGPENATLFSLVEGRNRIKISFEPANPNGTSTLRFYMESPNYTVPIFDFTQSEHRAGVIDTTFEVHAVMPKEYATMKLRARGSQ